MRIFRYICLLLSYVTLLLSCAKEQQIIPEPEVTSILPFSISVQPDKETRASFDGSSLASGEYVFAAGDKIYITGAEGQISGELTIASGIGTGSAIFSGELSCTGGFEPDESTTLSATLVGTEQSGFFTVSDGKITSGPTYPSSISYTTLADLVQRYSHFTGSFTYGIRSITLTQQTVFLNFSIELYASDLTGSPATVQMVIKDSDGGTPIFSVSDVPVGGTSTISKIVFTAVCPAGSTLQEAQTWVNNGSGIHCLPDFANTLTLEPNKYYKVHRSAVDDFTVEAPSTGNGASVTFNYTPVECRTYIGGVWSEWGQYTSTISLNPGEKVSFRGQRTSYANTGGSTPLITPVNNVYIYGDLMSLVCDENYDRHSSVGANAFYQAFKGSNLINIHPDKELILSAETLSTSCYEGMFQGCTGLTKLPVLPATQLADMCYNKMFMSCTGITTLPNGLLPAVNLAFGCYAKMFHGCSGLVTVPSSLLPATTLAKSCYFCMFARCSELTKAPELPAIDPQPGCYFTMFRWCSKLKEVKCRILLTQSQRVKTEPSGYTTDAEQEVSGTSGWTVISYWTVFNKWLNSVGANGTFYKHSDMVYTKTAQAPGVGDILSSWTIYNWE